MTFVIQAYARISTYLTYDHIAASEPIREIGHERGSAL